MINAPEGAAGLGGEDGYRRRNERGARERRNGCERMNEMDLLRKHGGQACNDGNGEIKSQPRPK